MHFEGTISTILNPGRELSNVLTGRGTNKEVLWLLQKKQGRKLRARVHGSMLVMDNKKYWPTFDPVFPRYGLCLK